MRCEKGATAENLEQIAFYLREAASRGVDILGFPEMSLSGYADPHRYPEAVLRVDGLEVGQLLRCLVVCADMDSRSDTGRADRRRGFSRGRVRFCSHGPAGMRHHELGTGRTLCGG